MFWQMYCVASKVPIHPICEERWLRRMFPYDIITSQGDEPECENLLLKETLGNLDEDSAHLCR